MKMPNKDLQPYQDMFGKMYHENGNTELLTKNITLVVTEKCNLRCTYCYELHKNTKRMSKEVVKATIDSIFDAYENDSHYINSKNAKALIFEFIGGEPLLEIDLIDYAVDYFKHKAISLNHPWAINYMIGMTTNGILYNSPKVQEFIEKNKNHLSMTITIDGNKELHDACRVFENGAPSYDIVEKAVKEQIKTFNRIHTKLTLAPQNVSYLVDALKNLYNLGLRGAFTNCVFEEGWDESHATILYNKMKELADWMIDEEIYDKFWCTLFDENIGQPMPETETNNWCGGTGKMLAIDVEGNYYPCLRYIPFTLKNDRKPLIIGDIYHGIEYTQEQRDCVNCLQCITRQSQSTEQCLKCPIAKGCAWCSAYNYDEFGTVDKRATYICIMHKARVLANAYFWNKYFRKLNSNYRFGLLVPKDWALEIISEEEYDMLLNLSKEL